MLESLEPSGSDLVIDAVEEAERAQLIAPQASGREARYVFAHELIRQTLADSLSLPRRQRLVARIAEALERVYASALEKQTSAIPHHLYQAGAAADSEKTVRYLASAADQALSAAAFEDALQHLDNALTLVEPDGSSQVADLRCKRAVALRSTGRIEEALADWQEAVRGFETSGDVEAASRARYEMTWTLGWAGRPAEAVGLAREGLQLWALPPPWNVVAC